MDAPFDEFLRGAAAALSDSARRGMELFAGKAGCAQCHSGPMLSGGGLHATGAPDHTELHTEPERQVSLLRHYATMGTPDYMNLRSDVGHYVVTKDKADIGRFVTLSLWDVGQTAPYMHSGVFQSLAAVVEFYDLGGGSSPNKSELLEPLELSGAEKANLVAFLEALSMDEPLLMEEPELPETATWAEFPK